MAVIDELIVRKGTTRYPIDSYDNQMIDEIVYEGQSFHFAKQKDLTGTSEIVADNGVAEPIISLGVSGDTLQSGTPTPETPIPIENANDDGMSMVLHGKNLATAQQIYKKAGNYAEVKFEGRNCIKFTDNIIQYTTIVGGFKENTRYTVSFWAKTVSRSGAGYSIALNIVNADETRNNIYIYPNTDWKKYTVTTNSNTTVVRMGTADWEYRNTIYIDVDTFCIYEGAITDPVYEPYFRETVEIPTNIDVNGTSVPLRFSEYDKLTVDRLNNKVVYTNGSYSYTYTLDKIDTALFYLNPQSGVNYIFHRVSNSSFLSYDIGKCSHFRKRPWWPLDANNSFTVTTVSETTNIVFRIKSNTTVQEFKQLMIDIANTGNPVVVQAKRITPIEYDITNTDLGQALLALATRKGTNIFEISSNLAPSQTDLSYWRQIIPNE